ncbi:MAG: hypothetical protein V7L26_15015 [Nostoc sp.]|uniref:hypothetical protein n=1 Tax=Nostoc sp. TaxID=1180 RepID=UPI002FF3CFAB
MDRVNQLLQLPGWTLKYSRGLLILEAPSLEVADSLIETENVVYNLAISAAKSDCVATIIRFPGCRHRPDRIPSSLAEKI